MATMTEWLEFVAFLVIGAWFAIAGLFMAWAGAVMGGKRNCKELLFPIALVLAGTTFLWVAFRDAPFTVSLKGDKS